MIFLHLRLKLKVILAWVHRDDGSCYQCGMMCFIIIKAVRHGASIQ